MGCSETAKKVIVYGVAAFLLVIGVLTLTLWGIIYNKLLSSELSISENSKGFNMWKSTPIPMYMEFYLFNWTNSAEVIKDKNIKPIFEECGPYVYLEHHTRVNLLWNRDDTITYAQKKVWHYVPEMSHGSLNDKITNLNVIATTIANLVKNNPLAQIPVNFLLQEKEKSIAITKTADEWLFKGIDDEILELIIKMNISGINLPFDKFGWFYKRNNSETYDGTFKMYRGTKDLDLLGIIEEWNGKPTSPYFDSYCSYVNGTSGELWPPVGKVNKVEVFSPDICSSVSLDHDGVVPSVQGVEGRQFEGTDYLFDNGTKYPEMACFNKNDVVLPSGVRDVSKCRFGAPAFVSYPHFNLADPSYREAVVGMHPNKSIHTFTITLEPSTGIPLNVNARLQINIRIVPIKGISMFKHVKDTMIPMLWFRQTATLTEEFSSQIKLLLILPAIGTYTGSGLVGIGGLILIIALYLSFRGAWKNNSNEQLLSEKSL